MNPLLWMAMGGGGSATAASVLGATLYQWHTSDVYSATGGASGQFRWTDRSGSRHLDAVSGSSSPPVASGGAVVLSGAADGHLNSIAAAADYRMFHDGSDWAAWAVLDPVVAATVRYVFATTNAASRGMRSYLQTTGAYQSVLHDGTTQWVATATPLTGAKVLLRTSVVSSSFASVAEEVGADEVSGTTTVTGTSASDPTSTLMIGNRPINLSNPLAANVWELVIAKNPTAQQVSDMQSHLIEKHSI